MQISFLKYLAIVPIILIGGVLPCAAEFQPLPAPGQSSQTISRYQQMLQGMSPGTLEMLYAKASALMNAYNATAPNSPERRALIQQYKPELQAHKAEIEELKQHKAELQGLRTQLCSMITC